MFGQKILVVALFSMLFGCTAPNNGSYYSSGVGLSLYTDQTAKNTEDQRRYFRELCKQSRPLADISNPNEAQCDLKQMVSLGFADIDGRCGAYLNWINSKRTDSVRVKRGVIALNTIATGWPGGNADSIKKLGQVLGLVSAVNDIDNSTLLLAKSSAVIDAIVGSRQLAYKKKFLNVDYPNYARATIALKTYLNICTPRHILNRADVNEFAAATGAPIPKPADEAKAAVEAMMVLTPSTKANVVPRRPINLGPCPNCSKVFVISGFRTEDIKKLQNSLCIGKLGDATKVDGVPGKRTLSALAEFDQLYGATKNSDKKITDQTEWLRLRTLGCQDGDIEAGYRSAYEKNELLGSTTVPAIIGALNAKLVLTGADVIDPTLSFNHPTVRSAFAVARSKLDFVDPNIIDAEEFSFALQEALSK